MDHCFSDMDGIWGFPSGTQRRLLAFAGRGKCSIRDFKKGPVVDKPEMAKVERYLRQTLREPLDPRGRSAQGRLGRSLHR